MIFTKVYGLCASGTLPADTDCQATVFTLTDRCSLLNSQRVGVLEGVTSETSRGGAAAYSRFVCIPVLVPVCLLCVPVGLCGGSFCPRSLVTSLRRDGR